MNRPHKMTIAHVIKKGFIRQESDGYMAKCSCKWSYRHASRQRCIEEWTIHANRMETLNKRGEKKNDTEPS